MKHLIIKLITCAGQLYQSSRQALFLTAFTIPTTDSIRTTATNGIPASVMANIMYSIPFRKCSQPVACDTIHISLRTRAPIRNPSINPQIIHAAQIMATSFSRTSFGDVPFVTKSAPCPSKHFYKALFFFKDILKKYICFDFLKTLPVTGDALHDKRNVPTSHTHFTQHLHRTGKQHHPHRIQFEFSEQNNTHCKYHHKIPLSSCETYHIDTSPDRRHEYRNSR